MLVEHRRPNSLSSCSNIIEIRAHINMLRKELYSRIYVYVCTDLYTLLKIHSEWDCCGGKTNMIKPEVVIRDHVISSRLKRRRPRCKSN